MKIFTLKRISMRDESTLGVLLEDKEPFCLTMELPWKDNQHEISCIPKGEYLCQRVVKIKHGECFEVLNVPNRDAILIHKGNFPTDSRGCIVVGEQFEKALDSSVSMIVTAVLASGKAYSELMTRLLGQDQFKLVIIEV